ncbi:hypothetical protein MMC25_006918 [Agyrium rufum]|nr:hypothetical protein [Agyrium rufum]
MPAIILVDHANRQTVRAKRRGPAKRAPRASQQPRTDSVNACHCQQQQLTPQAARPLTAPPSAPPRPTFRPSQNTVYPASPPTPLPSYTALPPTSSPAPTYTSAGPQYQQHQRALSSPPPPQWSSGPSASYMQALPYNVPPPSSQSRLKQIQSSQLLAKTLDQFAALDVGSRLPGRLGERWDGLQGFNEEATAFVTGRNGRGMCDIISHKLDAVINSIDGEIFSGDERELVIYEPPDPSLRGGWGLATRGMSGTANDAVSSAVKNPKSSNFFFKANLYANSRLPPYLPPLKLYLPSFPIICLAAKFSQRVYQKPSGKEREAHVDADWRLGTKAMVIKSVPVDDIDTIVFAIRGSQTFMDWAVNLRSVPISPEGFLDDPGNLCHAGFLSVARKMLKPVAARIRSLLEEDPSRAGSSLVMTGHSAGGAVASLLFMHMLSQSVRSELNTLTRCFKRIHCITFGTPPVSLLPLWKPDLERYRKSLFLSFINEGDPVPRADKAYIRSLLDLYASPPPNQPCAITALLSSSVTPAKFSISNPLRRPKPVKASSAPLLTNTWNWPVPASTLSNAGRLVALRTNAVPGSPGGGLNDDDVRAEICTDEQLREVVFGDPMMHQMKVYARRVEVLATRAVLGGS